MKYKPYRCIGITLSLLGSAIICFRSVLVEVFFNMDIGDWITIGGIVIGFVGVILGVTIPLRRDGKTIDETKAIASDIQPKINNIDHRTEKQLEKLGVLVAEVDYRKRVEANFPSDLSGRDMIHAGTQKLLREGAEVNLQYHELSLKYQQAQNRIMELNAENSQLRSQVAELRIRLQGYEQDYEWEP